MESIKQARKIKIKYIPPLVTLVVVIVLGLCYWFVFQPLIWQLMKGGNLDLASKEKELKGLEAYSEKQKEIVGNYKLMSDKDKVYQILPEQKDIPALFAQLEAIALDNGFRPLYLEVSGALGLAGDIKSLTVGRRKPLFIEKQSRSDLPEGVKEISLNYKIDEGEYENLKNFLRDLESNTRLFDVTSIQYHEKMKTYNMVLNTYYIED